MVIVVVVVVTVTSGTTVSRREIAGNGDLDLQDFCKYSEKVTR